MSLNQITEPNLLVLKTYRNIITDIEQSLFTNIVSYIYIYIYIYIRGAYDKFPDFFRMSTFIDSTHMMLESCKMVEKQSEAFHTFL